MGLDGPISSIRIVKISCEVTKASRKRPRAMEMDGSRLVATVSGPGRRAATKPAAAIPAMSCATVVCIARCQWILPVSHKAKVTWRYHLLAQSAHCLQNLCTPTTRQRYVVRKSTEREHCFAELTAGLNFPPLISAKIATLIAREKPNARAI